MRFTAKLAGLGLAATTLLGCAGAQAQKKSSDYWPMNVGNTWMLSMKIGAKTIVQTFVVTQLAQRKDEQRCVLEYTSSGKKIQTETYLKTSAALFRISAGPNGSFIANPPVPNIRYPLKSGATRR